MTFKNCLAEIRNGNLKAILGLFFSLSRYKQQQQQPPKQHSQHPPSQQPLTSPQPAGPPSQCQVGLQDQQQQQLQVPASPQPQCQPPQPAPQLQLKAQPEMQSRCVACPTSCLIIWIFFSLFLNSRIPYWRCLEIKGYFQ